ncbi:MAG TPA: NnrU family protein [Alphaproteobacteria bacterium]|nr:NnrU family protein [Alphaproteobacteria bacterium]
MSGTSHLLMGAALFYGGHVILASGPVRPKLASWLGERGFTMAYSMVALIGLLWLSYGYATAPRAPWWGPQFSAVPLLLMAPASLLFVGAFSQRNPTTVGQTRGLGADAARGVMAITRHPFLWSVALWAAGHLVVNGDFPSLVLFGGMLALALVGTVEIDRKTRGRDPAGWTAFASRTSNLPIAAIAQGRARLVWSEIGWWRLALAAAFYALLIGLHPAVFGVSPIG